MRDFFRSFLASLTALTLVIGGGCLVLVLLVVSLSPSGPRVPSRAILVLDLSAPIADSQGLSDGDGTLSRVLGRPTPGTPLPLLLEALDAAARDGRIAALFLTGNMSTAGEASGPAALRELREGLLRFKASGKPIVAYNASWGQLDYYLCASASTLVAHPLGSLEFHGYGAEPMFYGGLFKKYGVEVQVAKVGKFKGAVEPYTSDRLSPENRAQIAQLLGDLWGQWKLDVAKDRKVTPDQLQALADAKGVVSAKEAHDAGLVDRMAHMDEVLDELKKLSGVKSADRAFPQIAMEDFTKTLDPQTSGARIAVVYAEGEIVDGEGAAQQAGGERVGRELRKARMDSGVRAVVLRVNSPGGSLVASEFIAREVEMTRQVKPVVVSMGSTAASGGYWIATHGNRIFAQPTTITGSIGVFMILPNLKKLAQDHGITWDAVNTTRMGNLSTLTRPKTDAELARLQVLAEEGYAAFLDRVSAGRKLDRRAVHDMAQGRVWSGAEAKKLGLVDDMGGLREAVAHAARLAKIEANYRVDPQDPPHTTFEKLMHLLQQGDRAPLVRQGAAGQILQTLDQTLQRFSALNDPRGLYARMPFEVRVR